MKIYLDMKAGKLIADRTESGFVDLEKIGPFDVNAKETDDHRKTMSINYKNDLHWVHGLLCHCVKERLII